MMAMMMIFLEFVSLCVLTYLDSMLCFSCVSQKEKKKSCDTGYLTGAGQIVFAKNSLKPSDKQQQKVLNHLGQQMAES